MATDRRYPIGKFVFNPAVTPDTRAEAIRTIAELPRHMRSAVAPMTDRQLETPYRDGGWTVRQVVHHVVDSHMNAYVRFRWALTEDRPTLKPYDEKAWAELPDARTERVALSLDLLVALHARWVALLERLTADDFARRIVHPDSGEQPLDRFLQMYAWHGRHHLGHVHLVSGPPDTQDMPLADMPTDPEAGETPAPPPGKAEGARRNGRAQA